MIKVEQMISYGAVTIAIAQHSTPESFHFSPGLIFHLNKKAQLTQREARDSLGI